MRLIDSPLLQRLRRVKQLGFSYLTYPSAEHSRFIHSVGVAHVMIRFVEAIHRRAQEDRGESHGIEFVSFEKLAGLDEHDLVHAALLHDIGHLPFSHVTEKVIEARASQFRCGSEGVEKVRTEVALRLKKNLGFAEILSLLFILSDRFGKYYSEAIRREANSKDKLLTIACLVAGIPPNEHLTGIPELLSASAVDADKVDYINRDARNCGVPVGVDVARVFLRSGIVRVDREKIIELGLKKSPASHEFLFVINSSGLDTIDEILLARTALYQRVYFHSVTRAAERLLGKAIEAAGTEFSDALKLWCLTDEVLLDRMSSNVGSKPYAFRILNRDLPKKAFSFSPGLNGMLMPIEEILPNLALQSLNSLRKQVSNTIIEEMLREEKLRAGKAAEIEQLIKAEVRRISTLLNSAISEQERPADDVDSALILLLGTAHEKQIRHNQIVLLGGQLGTVRDYSNAREQQDAFELLKEVGFVFCDPRFRARIFFAARIVLASLGRKIASADVVFVQDNVEIRFVTRLLASYDASVIRSGVPAVEVAALARDLTQLGYFDDKPWAGPPVQSTSAHCTSIAEKFRRFRGERGWKVGGRSAAAFLSQFPPKLREEAGELLLGIELIENDAVVQHFHDKIKELPVGPLQIVPLSRSSGVEVRNWIKSSSINFGRELTFPTIVEALEQDGNIPVVFVDDNISSGTQARAQLLSWMGVPRDNWPDNCAKEEDLEKELSPDLAEKLRQCEIYVFAAIGRGEADKTVRECLAAEGHTEFKSVLVGRDIATSTPASPELTDFMRSVGKSLIAQTRFGSEFDNLGPTEKSDCAADALGYGNACASIATSVNVPTATYTALWLPGMYGGQPWIPLLLRRKKLRHLIVG